MKDKDGSKYYTVKEKCILMERTWQNVFRITDEEAAKFDGQHLAHINTYILISTSSDYLHIPHQMFVD